MICLLETLETGDYVGGDGSSRRDCYIGHALKKYLVYDRQVEILTLESFVAKAHAGSFRKGGYPRFVG